jgi:hypothetical protein
LDMARATSLSDGYVLKTPANAYFVFYQEGTDAIRMDLSSMTRPAPAIAVDTQTAYAEIDLGILPVADQTWSAPYPSDWAVAVGDFAALPPGTVPPAKPPVNPQEPNRLYLPLVLLVILLPTVLGLWVWRRAWLPFYKLKPKSKMFWSRL